MSVIDLCRQIEEANYFRASVVKSTKEKQELDLRTRRLCDYLESLELRFFELHRLQHELAAELVGSTKSLKELQRELLDATAAFHEQSYNAISCFTLYLQIFLPHEVARGKSLGTSMEQAINQTFPALLPEEENKPFFVVLEQMRVFRDNYLVHPQKTARMDWATYSTPEIVSAYYFEAADVNTKCSQNVHFVQSKNDDISAAIEALQAIYPWMKNIVFPPNFQTVYHATQIIIGLTVERFR